MKWAKRSIHSNEVDPIAKSHCAQKRNAAVATLDAELIANLKAIDIPVITLQKNRLTGYRLTS